MEFFEFVVEGPPVSVKAKKTNARRYQKWIKTVRSAAQAQWKSNRELTKSRAVVVSVTNYYTLSPPDVDNIIKPILDALESVVYKDDQQVQKVTCEKVGFSELDRIHDPSPTVAAALEKYTEVLHIMVAWEAED